MAVLTIDALVFVLAESNRHLWGYSCGCQQYPGRKYKGSLTIDI
jgi:hypothetical protein